MRSLNHVVFLVVAGKPSVVPASGQVHIDDGSGDGSAETRIVEDRLCEELCGKVLNQGMFMNTLGFRFLYLSVCHSSSLSLLPAVSLPLLVILTSLYDCFWRADRPTSHSP